MGIFDKLQDVVKTAKKIESVIDSVKDVVEGIDSKMSNDAKTDSDKKSVVSGGKLKLANSTHMYEDTEYCDDDEYIIRFNIDDTFKDADSGAAEVSMYHPYSPDSEYGEPGNLPYVAIENGNFVYNAVEEYKIKGTFAGAIDLVPLTGKFYFKAKKAYGQDMAYFYGIDRCDGFWLNNGICIVYPKSYVGTQDEVKAMQVLDAVANSYVEIKK